MLTEHAINRFISEAFTWTFSFNCADFNASFDTYNVQPSKRPNDVYIFGFCMVGLWRCLLFVGRSSFMCISMCVVYCVLRIQFLEYAQKKASGHAIFFRHHFNFSRFLDFVSILGHRMQHTRPMHLFNRILRKTISALGS